MAHRDRLDLARVLPARASDDQTLAVAERSGY